MRFLRNEAITVLLRVAGVAELFLGGQVVNVAVAIPGNQGEWRRRARFGVEPDLDGQFAGRLLPAAGRAQRRAGGAEGVGAQTGGVVLPGAPLRTGLCGARAAGL